MIGICTCPSFSSFTRVVRMVLPALLLLGTAWLARGEKPASRAMAEGSDEVAQLIRQLGDEDFEKREQAQQSLLKKGVSVLARLRQAADSPDAEVRRRIEEMVDTLERLHSGQKLVLVGHTRDVVSVALSPDGKLALSGAEDTTIRLWDLATGKQLRTFGSKHGEVWAVTFSPDGKRAPQRRQQPPDDPLGCRHRPGAAPLRESSQLGPVHSLYPGRQESGHRLLRQQGARLGPGDRQGAARPGWASGRRDVSGDGTERPARPDGRQL